MATVPTDDNSKGMFSAEPEQSESGIPLDYTKKQAPEDARTPAEDAVAPVGRGMFDDEEEAKPIGGGLFDPTEQLKAAVHYGTQTSPDEAARILQLKEATALPEDLVGRNADELMRMTRAREFNVPEFVKRSPITAEWLSESPNRTAATWDILPKLGRMEDFFKRQPEDLPMTEEHLNEMAEVATEARLKRAAAEPLHIGKRPMPTDEQGQKQMRDRFFQEELARLKQEEEYIAGDEPVGVWENLKRRFAENPTAAAPFYSGLIDLKNATELYQAAQAVIAKEASPEQMHLLVRTARLDRAAQRRGTTFLADVASLVGNSAVFAGEMGGTAPVYQAGKKLLYKEGAREAATGVLRKGMQMALESAGWAVGATAQTVANPIRVAEKAVSRMTPEFQQKPGDEMESVVINPNTELTWTAQVPKAFMSQWAEIAGERTGALLSWADKPINKALFDWWAKKVPSATAEMFEQFMKTAGVHGVLGEMGEEEATKFINHLSGVEEYRLPTGKELLTEAVGFAVPGASRAALTHVGHSRARTKSFTDFGNTSKEVLSQPIFQSPEGVKIVEQIAQLQSKDRPHVLMPVKAWNDYWTEQGKDPAQVWNDTVPDSQAQYEEATEAGTDLVIPTGRYAVTIAPSEHNKFFAKELRWKELERNEREAEEEAKAIEQADTEATKLELGTEGAKLRDELQAAGQAPELAEKNALLIQEFAARQDIPLELARTILPLAIQQGTPTKKDGGLEQDKITEPEPHVLDQSRLIDGTNVIDASETFKAKQEEGKSPLEIHLGEARILTNGELDDLSAELEIIKKAIEDEAETAAQISRQDFLISVLQQSKHLAQMAERPTIEKFKARFGEEKSAQKAIDKAQDPKKGPYVSDPEIPGIGWAPNYAAEPTGTIGPARISEANVENKQETDPLKWADLKYRITYQLILKHKEQGIPLVINTSSDAIGHDDYIAALPEGAVVNMYLLPDIDGYDDSNKYVTNRHLFPGNASRKRQQMAIDRMREAGVTVNAIEPTVEDVIKAAGGKTKVAKKLGVKSAEVEVEIKKAMGKHLRVVTLDQSALPAKSDLSPLGFYSQVAREVEKMDFKEMPAKDLWNRIKNIQGIKAEELEQLGLEEWLEGESVVAGESDGRVTKAEVVGFIKGNGVQVEQVVFGDSFKNEDVPRLLPQSRAEGDVPLDTELSWDEGVAQDPSDDYISNESDYYFTEYGMNGPGDHGFFGEKWGEKAKETLLELVDDKEYVLDYEKDDEGNPSEVIELEWERNPARPSRDVYFPTGVKGVSFGRGAAAEQRKTKLLAKIRRELEQDQGFLDEAWEAARQNYFDGDYTDYIYTESETGWELHGNSGNDDWYSPETRKSYSGSIEEAQIKLLEDMYEKGVVESQDMRDARTAEEENDGEPVPGVRYNLPIGPKPAPDVNTPTRPAKYASYMDRSNPGGKNKREFVFTSPQAKDYSGEYGGNDHYRERKQIASVITSDRTGPNGERILMIEESQSDRQAKVRNLRLQIAAIKEELKDAAPDAPERKGAEEKIAVLESQIESIKAPYENTEAWLALVMKNMIRVASQENYDAIAWSPAELVTKRWGTDALAWVKKTTQTYDVIDDYTNEVIGSYANGQDAENNMSDGRTVRPPGTYFYIDTSPSHGETGSGLHGMSLEEGAKARAKKIEKFGKLVTGPKEIEDVAGAMSDNPRFAATLWKRMQTEETGIKAPRKEGYEFEYDNLLPKKVVPAILKKLDKNAKVGVGKIGVPKNLTEDEFRDVWQVVLTDEMKAKAKTEGFSLFQPSKEDSDARGQIELYNDRAVMTLSTWSDASTVPHEFAHYFLQIMGILSDMPDATQRTKDRYAAALKFLGVASKADLKEEHHEKFARSFEAYLREGVAPTAQLKELFEQFKKWLMAVYQAAPPEALTPEAKEFFDSIFAAEAEVAAAKAQQKMTPLFANLKDSGMSDDDALKMQALINEVDEHAKAQLNAKVFQEADKKRSKDYEDQRELVRSQIAEEVSHQPVYIALSILQKGVFPDGSEIPDGPMKGLKLDRDSLKKEWPGQMKSLPKPYVYAKEGGLHPDMAAELLGFSSGSELITAMVEAEPMDQLVDRLTDEQMKAQFPSLQETGALSVEAMKAIHNDKQDELYRKELEYMLSEHFAKFKQMTRRIAGRPPAPTASIKEQAAAAIAKKQVRETNPLLYQRAEAKAGKEAMDLYLKGDINGAVEAKTRQRYNHALYRAAVEAKENAEKAAEYMRKFDKPSVRQRMGKAGGSYLEQIEAIQERFSFKTISGKAIDRKNDLRAWVEEQREDGYDVELPEKLLNESNRKNYKELTNAELAEVRETVENIEHLAGLKNKLLTNEKVREIEEAETMIVSSIGAHHEIKGEVLPLAPGLKDKILQKKSKYFAAHTRMEFLFEFLDGVKAHGAAWNLLFKPFVDAELSEMEMAKKDAEALGKIFGVYSQKERAGWFGAKTYFFPEARTDKFDGNLNKANILAIALNWGNEYNREALMEGYGWNEAQVLKILEVLDEKDVATVNALWAHIDTYWESARDLQKELSGVAPAKVQGSPAVIRAGKLNGGYYPIKFDNDRSYRQLQLDEKAALGEQFGHATRGMTRHGHLKERTNTGGKPLLLNLAVISGHLSQVRHDISHRRAVIDVGRLINRPKIREAIIGAAGSEMYRQLNPWIKGIAGDTQPDLIDGWESFLGLMRTNMTKVNLGLKVTSGLVQTLGFLNTIHVIGPTYAAKGLKALNPAKLKETWAFITERSAMMQNRLDNYDRDVRDLMMKQNVAKGADTAWFYHIGFMDLSLSVPTWLGAYQQAMDGEVENIDKGDEKSAVEYADSTVRKTMAAGAAKDLAQVQRGNELKRLFTAFYSQLSIQFNLMQQAGQHFGLTKDYAKLTSAFIFLWILPAILDDVIKGRGPDDEEEWLPWMAKKAGAYPFQTMVLTRDIVNMMERKFETGRRADYTMSPVVQGVESLANATYAGFKPFMQDEEFTRADAKDVVMATGYMVGLPSRQVWMTSEYLYDYMTGEVQPSNPAEAAWRALVTGKPKEK